MPCAAVDGLKDPCANFRAILHYILRCSRNALYPGSWEVRRQVDEKRPTRRSAPHVSSANREQNGGRRVGFSAIDWPATSRRWDNRRPVTEIAVYRPEPRLHALAPSEWRVIYEQKPC